MRFESIEPDDTRRHIASYGCLVAVPPACSLEPSGSGHAPDDLFDSASQGEQITVTTGGRIELEAEWKLSMAKWYRDRFYR